ncbi:MAG: amidohydrolase family protein, partial [SAR324 cluster bacterium]|nr:amidohydrolase family protein [SAR324 cluster bacterium]
METIFYNGRVNSLDAAGIVYTAVGVENGRIIRLGSDAELKPFTRAGTEYIDLKGAVMFPGFMEAHNHFSIIAYLLNAIDLSASKVACMADILSKVKAEAENAAPGT